MQVKSTFDSLTVWNLEQAPNSSDEILMALSWPKIAQGVSIFFSLLLSSMEYTTAQ